MKADALFGLFMDALASHRLIEFISYLTSVVFLVEIVFSIKRTTEFFLRRQKPRFSNKIANISQLSRSKTGYVGAFLAKYTVTVTLLILMISIAFNTVGALRALENPSQTERILIVGCISFIVMNILLVLSIITFVLLVCRRIVKDVETGVDSK